MPSHTKPIDLSSPLQQHQCPLFAHLPAEIRSEIFSYALSAYDDQPFSPHTYWYRPGYTASRRVATELLRACKRIYLEAWFIPFPRNEHIFFLTADERAPDRRTNERAYTGSLETLHAAHPDTTNSNNNNSNNNIDVNRIRVFAQLYMLEPGDDLQQRILNLPHFRPRNVTISLRYTDFWEWERNQPLHINAMWVNTVRWPDSVLSLTMEMETIERRKEEVDFIADAALESWFFRRRDGVLLLPQKDSVSVAKWTGSSMLGRMRWIRDETGPGKLDYHVVSVTWRVAPQQSKDRDRNQGLGVGVGVGLNTPCPTVRVPAGYNQPPPPLTSWISLREDDMRAAGVSPETPAEEALAAVRNYQRSSPAVRARARSLARYRAPH